MIRNGEIRRGSVVVSYWMNSSLLLEAYKFQCQALHQLMDLLDPELKTY